MKQLFMQGALNNLSAKLCYKPSSTWIFSQQRQHLFVQSRKTSTCHISVWNPKKPTESRLQYLYDTLFWEACYENGTNKPSNHFSVIPLLLVSALIIQLKSNPIKTAAAVGCGVRDDLVGANIESEMNEDKGREKCSLKGGTEIVLSCPTLWENSSEGWKQSLLNLEIEWKQC